MNKQIVERQSLESRRRNTAIGFIVGMMFGGLVDTYTGDLGIFTILGMILGSVFGYISLGSISWMEYPRGVLLRIAVAGAFFFGVLYGTVYVLDHGKLLELRSLLPYAPLLPGIFLIVSIGYAFSRLDELQSKIQVQAIAVGFGITALVSLTIGLLGLTGLNQPNWILVPVVMTSSWFIGKIWARWKYR